MRAAGGELREHAAVAGVALTGGRIRGVVLADGTTVRAEHVVVCAGVWSASLGGLPAAGRSRCGPSRARSCACTTRPGRVC